MRISKLPLNCEVILHPVPPFHFTGTVHKPSHFPAPVDRFRDGNLWFALRWFGSILGVQLSSANENGPVCMKLYTSRSICEEEANAVACEVRFRLGMDLDLTEFIKMAEKDPILAPIEQRWRGMRPSCLFSLYELLCITITLQNATVSRSVKMLEALLQRYGTQIEFGGECIYAFWPPSSLATEDESDLREVKVGYRAKHLIRVSRFFEDHPKFEEELRTMSKEKAKRRLQEIYGVGPATAWYLLFESLKHLDAFDYVSPWEQKILSKLLFEEELVPASVILEESKRRWGSWRMLAIHYLFEDLFWRRKHEPIDWLDTLIRL